MWGLVGNNEDRFSHNKAHFIKYNSFQNGVLLRTVLDNVTGDLSDTRTRYLGSRPVKLFRISMQGSEAVSCVKTLTLEKFGRE